MKEEKEKTKDKEAIHYKLGITKSGFETLNRFLELANRDSKRRIKIPEVLAYAVEKLGDKDIRKIQERVYTPDDKMEVMFEEYNQRNPDRPMTRDQFKGAMIEAFDKQVLSKLSKSLKTEQNGVLVNGRNEVYSDQRISHLSE